MVNKNILIFGFALIILSISTYAVTYERYWNLPTLTNNWNGAYTLVAGNSADSSGDYPVYPIFNSSAPGSLKFVAVNTDYYVPPTNSFLFTNGFSISFWMNISAYPASYNGIIGMRDDIDVNVGLNSNGSVWFVSDAGSSYSTAIPTNQWVHVVFTKSATTGIRTYIDGTLDASTPTATGAISASGLLSAIGAYTTGGGGRSNYYQGMLDEIRVYGKVLSTGEVGNLTDCGSIVSCPSESSSFIEITLNNIYNSTSITNFNATFDFSGFPSQTLNTTNGTIYVEQLNVSTNITFYNIGGSSLYYFNRTYTDYNLSTNLAGSVWNSVLYLNATDNNGNSITKFNVSNNYVHYSTANGTSVLYLSTGNLKFNASSDNYVTTNYTTPLLKNLGTYYDIVLFGNSTINLVFINESDNTIYNTSKIFVGLIAQNEEFSDNYSTSNGSVYIESLPNNYYNIIYSSDSSNTRSVYFFIPPGVNEINLTLYILDSDIKTRGFLVQNENGNRLSNVTIEIYKFMIGDLGWTKVGSYVTNTNGIVPVDSKDYTLYQYRYYYCGQLKLTETEFFVQAVMGSTKTITITTSENSMDTIIKLNSVNINMTNVSKTIVYNWDDTNIAISGACLRVFDDTLTFVGENCTTGYIGELKFGLYNYTSGNFIAQAFVNYSGKSYYKQSYFMNLDFVLEDLQSKKNFLWIAFITLIFLFVIFLQINVILALLISVPLPLFIFTKIGLVSISLSVVYYLFMLILAIAMINKSKGDYRG